MAEPRPPTVWIAAAALAAGVPLFYWVGADLRDLQYGNSRAAALTAPFFWAVLMFRVTGALVLTYMLVSSRKSHIPWVVVIATWLAGPPISFLVSGIETLSVSLAQASTPSSWSALVWSLALPMLVTTCLFGSKKARRHYTA
jgi:hypothetical protein